MKYLWILAIVVCACGAQVPPVHAQTYPTCPVTSSPTSCTIPVLITATATPVFTKLPQRQYLFLQNQGYSNTTLNNNAICCAIGSGNAPVWDGSHPCNGIVLQPGGVYEPPQIIKAQNAFTVPSGDVSCIAPFGNVELTAEQE